MARKSEGGEQTSPNNLDFHNSECDTELQDIFRKLRVNHRSKRVSTIQTRRSKTIKPQTKQSGHIPPKHKQKKILKDATFIFSGKTSENKTRETLSASDLKDSLPSSEPQRSSSSSTLRRVQGCGEQFRNEASVKVSESFNMDDTTPEELAAYFDQLLHIPKPMSQMAEMMYT